MKAREFSGHLAEAGIMLASVEAVEPTIVVRKGRDGDEVPLARIKVRSDVRRGVAFIILEID